MQDTLTIVLAGSVGSRLSPLTDNRAKPAVPFGVNIESSISRSRTACTQGFAKFWC